MALHDFPDLSLEILHAISERHGLGMSGYVRLASPGVVNAIYLLGDHLVLRVPRNDPECIASTLKEAAVAPAARRAGVRTPELVVFDDSRAILAVPYTIYERVGGEPLGRLELEPRDAAAAYRDLGRDLARLHSGVSESPGPLAQLETLRPPDPRPKIERCAADGYFTPAEARWLLGWLDRLAPAALAPVATRLLHADPQPNNVMVDPTSRAYVALLDWGDASWGDPALEFVELPLRAVPFALEGYRAVAPLAGDETAEARILWYNLLSAFVRHPLPPPSPDGSLTWGLMTVSRLLELMRFIQESPGTRWTRLID
jgi:aminoglycoside phosphotransferase (APT) family kinase protein